MMPLTANTMVRGPFLRIAQRKVPSEPSSFHELTIYTLPPLPPVVYFPAPSAPGKARTRDETEAEELSAHAVVGNEPNTETAISQPASHFFLFGYIV